MNDRIRQVNKIGQRFWIDNLHRQMLEEGLLARWIGEGASGITSNPSILEKAIRVQPGYRREIGQLARTTARPSEIYDTIVRSDIVQAADLLRPVWELSNHEDGFVSLEVSPQLAYESEATIAEAERLWALVRRPNVLIKVPATRPGLEAIAQLTERGVPVNVTLIFSIRHWLGVVDAYQRGLEARAATGAPLQITSVASFFVSRIDTAIDKILPAGSRLRGQIGIANAKCAYQAWRALQTSPRWQALTDKGTRPQRLLWGSTGTKDPTYSDVYYIEELIGPDTINTMPDPTLEAFLDHGHVRPSLSEGPDEAQAALTELATIGIDLDQVCEDLQRKGVQIFADSLNAALRRIAEQAEEKELTPSHTPPSV
jgi:transaldolase